MMRIIGEKDKIIRLEMLLFPCTLCSGSLEAAPQVESGIPALIPRINSAVERANMGSL